MGFILGRLVKSRQCLFVQISMCRNFDVPPPTDYLLNPHERYIAELSIRSLVHGRCLMAVFLSATMQSILKKDPMQFCHFRYFVPSSTHHGASHCPACPMNFSTPFESYLQFNIAQPE
jgi:hypothetical protein